MKLLAGIERPDQGLLSIPKGARIGSLAQIPDYNREETVYDVLLGTFADVRSLKTEMRHLEAEMAEAEDSNALDSLLQQYVRLQERRDALQLRADELLQQYVTLLEEHPN
ncbi:hypothetical protein U9M73_16070 [Paenibacillus phoenicis]|uniref:Uncharacterized protein n=1 Tax=Paenibacillus phoenicis TaxID=554117 RepID=A0ABU5PNE3_9BACL|nr:hypothetical protein [Paenibacillus phoenicis]MEA3571470.1 hypothetical protein [Paenibacillus phoenicis]